MSIDPLPRFQQWKLCDPESLKKSAGDNTVLYTLYLKQHPAGIHKCPYIFLSSLQKSFTTFKIERIMRDKKQEHFSTFSTWNVWRDSYFTPSTRLSLECKHIIIWLQAPCWFSRAAKHGFFFVFKRNTAFYIHIGYIANSIFHNEREGKRHKASCNICKTHDNVLTFVL